MRVIDSNKLKETINRNKYLLRNASNTHDYGMFTIGIYKAIDEQPELPTIQSNDICNYCNHYETGRCPIGVPQYRCFEGKKAIEVEE